MSLERRVLAAMAAVLASGCAAAAAWAADAPPVPPQAFQPSPVSFWSLVQVLFALALVLGAVALSAWLLRRFAGGQRLGGGSMRVVGGVAVGPKERVVLVEVGDVWLVVGVAPGQVNALHTMPKQHDNAAVDSPAGEQKNFALWLKQAMQGRKPNT